MIKMDLNNNVRKAKQEMKIILKMENELGVLKRKIKDK